jgi:hypothetical protein
MSAGAQLQGLDGIARFVQLKALKVSQSLDGTRISVVPSGARGADQNAIIARAQANRGRAPWYISREDMEPIRFVAKALGSADAGVRQQAITSIGQLMLAAIGNNIAKQSNADGARFAPLTAAYAAFKRRKFGFIAPILKATNDLLGGLRVKIDRIRS